MLARFYILLPAVLWLSCGQKPAGESAQEPPTLELADLEMRDGLEFQKGTNTPFTGTVVERYHDGQRQAETAFNAGRRHGLRTVWYENGKIRSQLNFVSGLPDGESKRWNEEGWLEATTIWQSGRIVERRQTERFKAALTVLADEREKLNATLWREEELAQEHEDTFVSFWDALRAASDKWTVFLKFGFDRLVLGKPLAWKKLDWGIEAVRFEGDGSEVLSADWPAFLSNFQKQGIEVIETEWHQEKFDSGGGKNARSVFRFLIHAQQLKPATRYTVRGRLHIDWASTKNHKGLYRPATIEVRDLRIMKREGPTAFESVRVLDPNIDSTLKSPQILAEPLLVYDLNNDGLSEVMLVGGNLIYWNEGRGNFRKDKLCAKPLPLVGSAVLADFNGDTRVDLMVIQDGKGPALFLADEMGLFSGLPRRVKVSVSPLDSSIACTAGDIDGDGDLDVWVTQYKPPYLKGNFPQPYFDSNDGWPSYLLINDGWGNFQEGTKEAGLADKRYRRTWASSFVDLDKDHDLDLLVINDFAGLDVYHNDGTGKFKDVTSQLGEDRHSFGMSHALADFNRDGQVDLYMTGMGSTTARRLEAMGAGRKEFPLHQAKRMKLGYGNRMMLNTGGQLKLAENNDQVARTGWSWGCTAFDVDNDGDRDLFVTNGNVSGESAKDYCTTFWRHDIYESNSKGNTILDAFYGQCLKGTDIGKISWNGFEHNVLFLNRGKEGFENVAFLMGVSDEYDSRGAVNEDLDGDGRPDLLVVEQMLGKGGEGSLQKVHVLRNQWPGGNNWVGVRLRSHGNGYSPIGATITVRTSAGSETLPLVTGDSFCAQHSGNRVFGLGKIETVESIEVRWPNGQVSRRDKPAVGRYHELRPE